jgi:hypothetical protein
MNATTNGRPRKSLAEQIDRLDRTLDGLADALNESVATAVREAVQGVLAELLADAGLRAQLQAVQVPMADALAPVAGTPAPSRLRAGCSRVWHGLIARVRVVCQALQSVPGRAGQSCRRQWERLTFACSGATQRVRDLAVAGWYGLRLVRHVLIALATALAVGGLVSAAAYFAGPTLAAAASGVCGFVTTLAVQTDGWFRRALLPMGVGGE